MSFVQRLILVTGISMALVRPVIAQHGPDWTAPKADPAAAPAATVGTPPGTLDINKVIEDVINGPGSKDSATATSSAGNAHTTGASKAGETFNSTPPTVKTPGGAGAQGGGTDAHGVGESPEPSGLHWWASPWFWCGVLCFLAAAALVVLPKLYPAFLPVPVPAKVPLALAVAGGALIFAAMSPGLFTIAVVAALCVLVVPKVWTAVQQAQQVATLRQQAATANATAQAAQAEAATHRSALSETLEATLTDNPQAKASLLAHLDKRADPADKTTILATIAKDGLNLS